MKVNAEGSTMKNSMSGVETLAMTAEDPSTLVETLSQVSDGDHSSVEVEDEEEEEVNQKEDPMVLLSKLKE
jgi:hypothetical protein